MFHSKVTSRSSRKRTMMIALTYQCQCRCVHCGSSLYRLDKKRELTRDEILELINSAKKLKVTAIYLFLGGEPLLLPELPDYIRHAKTKGFLVKLDTNGLLLNEAKVKELRKSGIDRFGVSIDSPYGTIHDKLRGMNGIFNKAIEGIKYCRKYGIYCYVSVYATKENLKNGELLQVINMAKNLGAKTRILSTICSVNGLTVTI